MYKLSNLLRRQPDKAADAVNEAYRQWWDSDNGQLVLEDLSHRFHLLNSTASHPNMAMAEGERNVILYILTRMRRDTVHNTAELADELANWPPIGE
jgi:hypothetical protein